MSATVHLRLNGTAKIDPAHLWGDDVPHPLTAQDVIEILERGEGVHATLGDLRFPYEVTIEVDDNLGPDPDALFPSHTEKRLVTARTIKAKATPQRVTR